MIACHRIPLFIYFLFTVYFSYQFIAGMFLAKLNIVECSGEYILLYSYNFSPE